MMRFPGRMILATAAFGLLAGCGSVPPEHRSFPDQDGPDALRTALPLTSYYAPNLVYQDPLVHPWAEGSPEAGGLDRGRLDQGAAELEKIVAARSFLVIRHGRLVYERYFHGGTPTSALNIHSASKSLLSALVGCALRDGLIPSVDTPLCDLLPYAITGEKRKITVRHLLTMTSGLGWIEETSEPFIARGDDWVQAILDLPLVHEPGTTFNYSTGNTHLLGAVLAQVSGMTLYAYADKTLLGPLGITVERWGRDPSGYYSGGCNLFMTPREMARFGELYLESGHGVPSATALVPQNWVLASQVPQGEYPYYSYLWWPGADWNGHPGYRAWGYGKQMIFIYPDADLVIVLTHDTAGEVYWDNLIRFVGTYVVEGLRD